MHILPRVESLPQRSGLTNFPPRVTKTKGLNKRLSPEPPTSGPKRVLPFGTRRDPAKKGKLMLLLPRKDQALFSSPGQFDVTSSLLETCSWALSAFQRLCSRSPMEMSNRFLSTALSGVIDFSCDGRNMAPPPESQRAS